MWKSLKKILRNDQQIQFAIWMVFPILLSTPVFQKYPLGEALWITAAMSIYAYWLIFGHFYFALKFIQGKERNKFKYLTRLVIVLAIGILIHGLGEILLSHFIEKKEEYDVFQHVGAFMLWTAIEGLLLMLFSSLVKFSFDYFKLQAQQQQMENQRLEAELKYLKLQINPHFLFNTLNNLLLLTNKQSALASTVVEKLAYMMRYLLEKDRNKTVPLQTEIDFINAYIDLEKIRIKNIDISFDMEGELQAHSIPPALLIILVENAFKHGVKKSAMNNFVYLELNATPQQITFQVTNPIYNGPLSSPTSHSIGLENLKKRLHLLFPNRHQLQVGPKNEHLFEAKLRIDT